MEEDLVDIIEKNCEARMTKRREAGAYDRKTDQMVSD